LAAWRPSAFGREVGDSPEKVSDFYYIKEKDFVRKRLTTSGIGTIIAELADNDSFNWVAAQSQPIREYGELCVHKV